MGVVCYWAPVTTAFPRLPTGTGTVLATAIVAGCAAPCPAPAACPPAVAIAEPPASCLDVAPPPPAPLPAGLVTGPIDPKSPVCGVLSEAGYQLASESREQLAFLVPAQLGEPQVARFVVVNETGQQAPLAVYADWWFCVTEGQVVSLPGKDGEYGRIEAIDFTIDQSTGERGME